MGRKQRVEFQGALYHVIQRGNNREYIFDLPEYKKHIIEQLVNAVKVDGVQIFAYVIMGNHYHLALRTNRDPLSKVMHRINTRFSRYYNLTRKRTGPVFESRYKAFPVEDESYLLALTRYIHRNPIRAGICKNVSDYRWSSDSAYRGKGNGFVHTKLLLDILSKDMQRALKEYTSFMARDDDVNWESTSFIGQESFALKVEPIELIPDKKRLDEILMDTGLTTEEFKLIKSGSRKRSLANYKARYAKNAIELGYTLQEIGTNIGISAAAIHKRIQTAKSEYGSLDG